MSSDLSYWAKRMVARRQDGMATGFGVALAGTWSAMQWSQFIGLTVLVGNGQIPQDVVNAMINNPIDGETAVHSFGSFLGAGVAATVFASMCGGVVQVINANVPAVAKLNRRYVRGADYAPRAPQVGMCVGVGVSLFWQQGGLPTSFWVLRQSAALALQASRPTIMGYLFLFFYSLGLAGLMGTTGYIAGRITSVVMAEMDETFDTIGDDKK